MSAPQICAIILFTLVTTTHVQTCELDRDITLQDVSGVAHSPLDAGARQARDITLQDVSGVAHSPLDAGARQAIVLIFIAHDCPIANSYVPEINRITTDYALKGIKVYAVHADPDLTTEAAKKHAEEYKFRCPVLLDTAHVLVKRTMATVTPECVVLSPRGQTLYKGRINDRYVDFGKARRKALKHDLRAALDAVIAKQPIRETTTVAVGCRIPDLLRAAAPNTEKKH